MNWLFQKELPLRFLHLAMQGKCLKHGGWEISCFCFLPYPVVNFVPWMNEPDLVPILFLTVLDTQPKKNQNPHISLLAHSFFWRWWKAELMSWAIFIQWCLKYLSFVTMNDCTVLVSKLFPFHCVHLCKLTNIRAELRWSKSFFFFSNYFQVLTPHFHPCPLPQVSSNSKHQGNTCQGWAKLFRQWFLISE